MWVFLNDAFLSIVASDQDPSMFAVRARKRQDLLNAFPDCQPIKGKPTQDYAWRAFLDRDEVEAFLIQRLRDVEYHNFKDSIARTPEGEERHDAYIAVWSAMERYGRGLFARRRTPKWSPGKRLPRGYNAQRDWKD